jgi:CheY-like chemotaxis protein
MKVLVVDDDPVILAVASKVLQGLGHEVISRDRALGTSAAIYQERPDVALVDVEMPGLSGDTLVRLLQKREFASGDHETIFIFYSGREREELDRLVEETGVAGAIDKASGPSGLAKQFNEITSRR